MTVNHYLTDEQWSDLHQQCRLHDLHSQWLEDCRQLTCKTNKGEQEYYSLEKYGYSKYKWDSYSLTNCIIYKLLLALQLITQWAGESLITGACPGNFIGIFIFGTSAMLATSRFHTFAACVSTVFQFRVRMGKANWTTEIEYMQFRKCYHIIYSKIRWTALLILIILQGLLTRISLGQLH